MFKNIKTAEQVEQERLDGLADQIRNQRNTLIAETDYLIMPDYPMSKDKKDAVRAYRKELRDISKQKGFPENVDFPEKPEFI